MGRWPNLTAISAFVIVVVSAIIVRLDSPFEPIVWRNPTSLPALQGTLSRNERLLATEHLHEDELIAPEAFAEGDGGEMYTGLWDGRVVALDAKGENPKDVFFVGGVVSTAGRELGSTTGVDFGTRLLSLCQQKAREKTLTLEDEKACGRPLGVRWREGKLFILDAYHGLFELDVKRGVGKHLIDSRKDVPGVSGQSADAEGHAAKEATFPAIFLNDFIFADDGMVYLTDSSWKHPRAMNRQEIIDGGARGRLLRFDPTSRALSTVMCGLHFPNGLEVDVQALQGSMESEKTLSSEEHLEGQQDRTSSTLPASLEYCGESNDLPTGVSIFAEGLPGFVDNLTFDEDRGAYLGGLGSKVAAPFSALHLALKSPAFIRTLIGKLVPIPYLEKIVPSYGLIIVLGLDGTIKESMHDATGRTAFISSAHVNRHSGYTFLGSSQNSYLGRVRL